MASESNFDVEVIITVEGVGLRGPAGGAEDRFTAAVLACLKAGGYQATAASATTTASCGGHTDAEPGGVRRVNFLATVLGKIPSSLGDWAVASDLALDGPASRRFIVIHDYDPVSRSYRQPGFRLGLSDVDEAFDLIRHGPIRHLAPDMRRRMLESVDVGSVDLFDRRLVDVIAQIARFGQILYA